MDRGGVGGDGVHGWRMWMYVHGHGRVHDGNDDDDDEDDVMEYWMWNVCVDENVKNIDCSIHLLVLGFYFASYNQPIACEPVASVLVELEDMWMVDYGMVDFVLCLVLNSKLLWQQVYLSILAAVGLCF